MNLLLDFDGVLFDSSWEVTAIILLTYTNFPNSNIYKYLKNSNTIRIFENIGKYSPEHAFLILQNENKKINNYFRKFRTYCIDVDDFFVVSSLLDDNFFDLHNLTYKRINDDFYYNYKRKLITNNNENLKKFINLFYESRRYIKENNEEFWIKLNKPFEEEINFLLQIYNYHNIGILSTKQKYAIISILRYYNIPIENDKIFAKENDFIHKGKKIKEIANLWSVKEEEINFVDDLIENLLKVKQYAPKVNLFISAWGYNNYNHRNLAKKNGIKVINSLKELFK